MPESYAIKLKGSLDRQWSDWFEGLSITHDERGDTLLMGEVADQAALYGILTRARDLGLVLIAVNHLEPTAPLDDKLSAPDSANEERHAAGSTHSRTDAIS